MRASSIDSKQTNSIKVYQSVNFGFLFGAGPKTAKTQAIEPNWSKESCEKYILANNLEMLKDEEGQEDYFLTVAKDIRKKFFETYVGLDKWIKDTQDRAKNQGYIQSIYGAFRRLPELRIATSLKDYLRRNPNDKEKYSEDLGMIANLQNISLNSPIQNMESVVVHRTMIAIWKFIKKNKLKSRIFAQVHDAVEIYAYKDEVELLADFIGKEVRTMYPEYRGIPIEAEANVADYWGKKELWDHGKEIPLGA